MTFLRFANRSRPDEHECPGLERLFRCHEGHLRGHFQRGCPFASKGFVLAPDVELDRIDGIVPPVTDRYPGGSRGPGSPGLRRHPVSGGLPAMGARRLR